MHIRNCVLFFISFCTTVQLCAQSSTNQVLMSDQDNISKISKGGGSYRSTRPPSTIEGSPYLFESAPAKVYQKGSSNSLEMEVSYEAARDIFQMFWHGQLLELDPQKVDSVLVDSKKFIYTQSHYFESLNDLNVPLLKKNVATILKPNYVPALNTGSTNSQWQLSSKYYIVFKEVLKEIKFNKKSLQKATSFNKEFEELIKSKNLKFSSEEDFIKILRLLK